MNTLYLYLTFFILLLLGASICLIISLKKYYKIRNEFKPKLILFSLLSTIIISVFASIYCGNLIKTNSKSIKSISRPSSGEGDKTISINVESDIYSGTIDLEIQEKKLTFEEANKIFSKYREELDSNVLGDNISFLKVSKPLNFPSSIGDEEISISWYISNPSIIDYTGNILPENIVSEFEELEIIATLTLDDHIAEICYFIKVYKEQLSPKDKLSSFLNQTINDENLLSKNSIDLPTHMNNIDLYFYEKPSTFPPIFFYTFYYSNSYTFCCSRA